MHLPQWTGKKGGRSWNACLLSTSRKMRPLSSSHCVFWKELWCWDDIWTIRDNHDFILLRLRLRVKVGIWKQVDYTKPDFHNLVLFNSPPRQSILAQNKRLVLTRPISRWSQILKDLVLKSPFHLLLLTLLLLLFFPKIRQDLVFERIANLHLLLLLFRPS